MTERQARQIRELRSQGQGYKAIANKTGLNRDAVRYYCKRHSLEAADSKAGEHCPLCGARIMQPQTGRKKRFCGESCRRAWWKKHTEAGKREGKALYHLVCVHCGKAFDSYGNARRRYCCRACYFEDRFA